LRRVSIPPIQTKYMTIFEEARNVYPGNKRGSETEYDNFVKKHKDWKDVLPLLKPAIEAQIEWRKNARSTLKRG